MDINLSKHDMRRIEKIIEIEYQLGLRESKEIDEVSVWGVVSDLILKRKSRLEVKTEQNNYQFLNEGELRK